MARAVGIYWFRKETYAACRKIMDDPESLPVTYSEWREDFDRLVKKLGIEGVAVLRTEIDPDTFRAWCTWRGCKVDANARSEFAAQTVRRKLRY
jgi:hypothetical protein